MDERTPDGVTTSDESGASMSKPVKSEARRFRGIVQASIWHSRRAGERFRQPESHLVSAGGNKFLWPFLFKERAEE
jgi:hypothetical protein